MTRCVLTNCYTPVRAVKPTSVEDCQTYLVQNRTNGDGEPRTKETLRRLVLETSILTNYAGSSLVELGHTKVLGQLTISTDGNHSLVETGVLLVRVNQVANLALPSSSSSTVSSLDVAHNNNSNSRKSNSAQGSSVDLEARIHTALLPTLHLADYPKTVLQLDITVLQNDGSLLSACMLAATLALADARVELYDLVTCCEVVVVVLMTKKNDVHSNTGSSQFELLVDPTLEEERAANAKITLAIMPQWKEVTLWQQSGGVSSSIAEQQQQVAAIDEAMKLCHDGCRTLHRFLRQHLLDKEQE